MLYVKDVFKEYDRLEQSLCKILMNIFITGILFFWGIKIALSNYLLFHISIEMFCTLISFGILVITLNASSNSKNASYIFLGIGYGFVGFIDIIHALSYKGMGIFEGVITSNITIQLWIVGMYMEAATILISFILAYKPSKSINLMKVFWSFFIVTAIIILTIFKSNVFPRCFIEGVGLTSFKIISENIIVILLICSIVLLFKIRKRLDSSIIVFMALSIIFTVISELCFMAYNDIYGIVNILGHNFKAISFYYIYKSIIEVGLKNPYKTLFDQFNDVNEKLKIEFNQRMSWEEKILENSECYDLLIESSKDAIFIHVNGKIIFANDALIKLIGASSLKQVIDREVIMLWPKNIRENIRKHIRDRCSGKFPKAVYETEILKCTGEVIDTEVRATSFNYKGSDAVLVIFRDITSQKQVEKLKIDIYEKDKKLRETEEFNKLITEFFSNISHELKTPLNVILGAVQVMKLNYRDEDHHYNKQNNYLNIIKQNCYRLLRLVNNIIDLSKIDSGFLNLNLSNHNIINVTEEITLSVSEYIESKGVALIFDTNVEEKVMAIDPDKIERIMLNLLSNAIKFTNTGDEIRVNIVDKNDRIFISVEDTGVGIPEDKLQMIFERFGQVEKTIKRNKEGSGIGLSLVESLVDLHGGNISVRSRLGEGSEFVIELPVKLVIDEEKSNNHNMLYESKVERINIEFSDIYS